MIIDVHVYIENEQKLIRCFNFEPVQKCMNHSQD